MIKKASEICSIPLIISGGFGVKEHLDSVLKSQVDAVAVADSIHYNRHSIAEIKDYIEKINC